MGPSYKLGTNKRVDSTMGIELPGELAGGAGGKTPNT